MSQHLSPICQDSLGHAYRMNGTRKRRR